MATKELPEKVTDLATMIGETNMDAVKEVLNSNNVCLQVVTKERPVTKVICDPVHGHIELHPVCIAIIDTPQFQRLRYLKQMGTCDFVYPGAVHTRFAHSIGACHLAGLLTKSLQQKQPELGITDKDVLCVQIAGLCHDMGHGPFSHIFDSHFIKSIDSNSDWKHEDSSVSMLEKVYESKKVEDMFKEHYLNNEDRNFIKQQIKGLETTSEQLQDGREKKRFLYDIVANKRNGIDVDKWDYISRDSFHLGMKSSFDHLRFIHFARVVDVNGERQICLRDKRYSIYDIPFNNSSNLINESYIVLADFIRSSHLFTSVLSGLADPLLLLNIMWQEAYEVHLMYETRYILYKKACHHRVTSSTSLMIVDALKEANDWILIPNGNSEPVKMSECIKEENISAFTNLTEEIIHRIALEPDDNQNLKKAKKLLSDLWRRNLYAFVAESSPFQRRPSGDEQKIKEEILLKAELQSVKDLQDRIIVEIINFDYGMKEKNPWDHIHFYSKDNPQKVETLSPEKIFLKPTEAPSNDSAEESAENDEEKCKKDKEDLRKVFESWCKEQK